MNPVELLLQSLRNGEIPFTVDHVLNALVRCARSYREDMANAVAAGRAAERLDNGMHMQLTIGELIAAYEGESNE